MNYFYAKCGRICREILVYICVVLFLVIAADTWAVSEPKEDQSNYALESLDTKTLDNGKVGLVLGLKCNKCPDSEVSDNATKTLMIETPYEIKTEFNLEVYPAAMHRVIITTRSTERPDTKTGVFIVSLDDTSLLDEIWCYGPSVSPNGHFLAYQLGRSNHGPDRLQSDLLTLYPLNKSPEENRSITGASRETENTLVGTPLYPADFAKDQRYFSEDQWYGITPDFCKITSSFLWSEDSASIVFLALYANRAHITRVYINRDTPESSICETLFEFSPLMIREDAAHKYQNYPERNIARLYYISIEKMQWDDPKHIFIWPISHEVLKPMIRLAVPD